MTDPHVARCLDAIRERSATISSVVRPLAPGQWQASTNCPPWLVADLATHIATSGQGFVRSIRRGLEGIVEPAAGGARAWQGGPPEVAEALTAVTDEFESLYDGLSDAQLDTVCFHRRGNRSIRWYAAHRLAEVSFHGWDLDVSLGRPASLTSEVAWLLLPTLLESNVPRTYAAGLSAERGTGERYLLVAEEEPSSSSSSSSSSTTTTTSSSGRWLVTINPDTLDVSRDADTADLTITAPASILALLVYGRADLGACGARLEGDPRQVDRFARIFPRP